MAQRLACSTVRRYIVALDRHVLPRLGDVPLRKVKPSHVINVLVPMDRAGLGSSSQSHVLCELRRGMESGGGEGAGTATTWAIWEPGQPS